MNIMRDTKQEVLRFWFEETAPQQWFQINESFDRDIRERFLITYEMALNGLCESWKRDAEGALALCIVLDQFPRNMFRGDSRSYASDQMALLVSKEAIHKGFDQLLTPLRRRFLYLPFEHSEELREQKRSLELFSAMKELDPVSYEYAVRHHAVIEKFGRFPHRNAILGRSSTQEELEFLSKLPAGF